VRANFQDSFSRFRAKVFNQKPFQRYQDYFTRKQDSISRQYDNLRAKVLALSSNQKPFQWDGNVQLQRASGKARDYFAHRNDKIFVKIDGLKFIWDQDRIFALASNKLHSDASAEAYREHIKGNGRDVCVCFWPPVMTRLL
jgi:hypothetical protein